MEYDGPLAVWITSASWSASGGRWGFPLPPNQGPPIRSRRAAARGAHGDTPSARTGGGLGWPPRPVSQPSWRRREQPRRPAAEPLVTTQEDRQENPTNPSDRSRCVHCTDTQAPRGPVRSQRRPPHSCWRRRPQRDTRLRDGTPTAPLAARATATTEGGHRSSKATASSAGQRPTIVAATWHETSYS